MVTLLLTCDRRPLKQMLSSLCREASLMIQKEQNANGFYIFSSGSFALFFCSNIVRISGKETWEAADGGGIRAWSKHLLACLALSCAAGTWGPDITVPTGRWRWSPGKQRTCSKPRIRSVKVDSCVHTKIRMSGSLNNHNCIILQL